DLLHTETGRPNPARGCLTSADTLHFSGPPTCDVTGTTYKVKLDSSNWFSGVIVVVHARDDFQAQDPHNTTLLHTIDNSTTDASYGAASVKARISRRLDVTV